MNRLHDTPSTACHARVSLTRALVLVACGAPFAACALAPSDGAEADNAALSGAPSVRAATHAVAANATSLALARPTTTVAGDVLIALVTSNGGDHDDVRAPSGWSLVTGSAAISASTGARTHAFVHVAGSSEPGSYAFATTAGNSDLAGGLLDVAGADAAHPIDVAATQSSNGVSTTSCTAPSVTTSVAAALLVRSCSAVAAVTMTPPTGVTPLFAESTSGTYRISLGAGTSTQSSAGATGSATYELSTAINDVGLTLAIRPAAASTTDAGTTTSDAGATTDAGSDGGSSGGTTVRKHVPTWAYVGGLGGQTDGTTSTTTNATSTSHVRAWLDFAEAGWNAHEKAFLDCGGASCTPVAYFDPAKIHENCSFDQKFLTAMSGNEAAFYHQASPISSSNRIEQTGSPGCSGTTTAYFPDPGNAGVRSYWQSTVRASGFPANTWGFSDDSGDWCTMFDSTTPNTIPVELGGSSTCATTHSQQLGSLWSAMTWSSGAPFPIVYNGLAPKSAFAIDTDLSTIEQAAARGGVGEGTIVGRTSATGTIFPRAIPSVLDTLSLVNTQTTDKSYVMLAYLNAGATGPCSVTSAAWYEHCDQLEQRRVALGALWLGFEPGREVLWEATNVATQLQVWPEASIYPTRPLQTMTAFTSAGTNGTGCGATASQGGAADLLVHCGTLSDGTPDGVYRREFAACYDFGTLVGPCAVLLNTTASAVTVQSAWLHQAYAHSLVLHGGDVLAAGCGNGPCPTSALDPKGAAFTAGSTQVPAVDALFLF